MGQPLMSPIFSLAEDERQDKKEKKKKSRESEEEERKEEDHILQFLCLPAVGPHQLAVS